MRHCPKTEHLLSGFVVYQVVVDLFAADEYGMHTGPTLRSCLLEYGPEVIVEPSEVTGGGVTQPAKSCNPRRVELAPGENVSNALVSPVMPDGLYPDSDCQTWSIVTSTSVHQVYNQVILVNKDKNQI